MTTTTTCSKHVIITIIYIYQLGISYNRPLLYSRGKNQFIIYKYFLNYFQPIRNDY